MKHLLYALGALLALLALGLTSGCGRSGGFALSEEDEPDYRKGESLLKENRMDEALLAFEKVVDARRDSPESHLELGRIYLDHVKDPVAAIYHFRKYLELRPDSDTAREVTQLIETAKKDFARTLPGDPFGMTGTQVDALDQLRSLRAENAQLKKDIAALRGQPAPTRVASASATTQPAANPAPAQPKAAARSYTVQTGDTLSKISDSVYGTTARWQEIYDANRNQLKNPHDLKVGMTLVIP